MKLFALLIGGLSQCRGCYGLNRFGGTRTAEKLGCFGGYGLRCGFCFLGRHGIWFGLWEILNFLPNV